MMEVIIKHIQDHALYIESAFLLILLMFYTRKIKTITQAISVWFIAVIFSSLTVPAIIELYIPQMKNNVEVISLIVVLFDVILVPVIIRLFAKDLFTNIIENRIVSRLKKDMEEPNIKEKYKDSE